MVYVLGIDGGGTGTTALLMDPDGQVLGRGKGGSANPNSAGLATTRDSLQTAITQALGDHRGIPIRGMGLGLAGVYHPEDRERIWSLLQELSQSHRSPLPELTPERIVIQSDVHVALVGGIGQEQGIVVIAGTGSIAYGCNAWGHIQRAGGWGYRVGDEGSAYWIARQGIQAALRARDGRSPRTALVEQLQEALELTALEEIREWVYGDRFSVKAIAALAPLVDQAAVAGDQVAQAIMDQAAQELVLAAQAVFNSLFSESDPETHSLELVTVGSVWKSQAGIRRQFEVNMATIAPQARIIWPRHEPAYGAGLLALKKLKGSSKGLDPANDLNQT